MHVVLKAVNAWLQFNPETAVCVVSDSLYSYTRDQRIVKTDEYSSVFRLRPVYRTAHFVLYVRRNNLNQARLGAIVAKRLAPRAVTRNTVKRLTREIFRQTQLAPIDCIVRLSKSINRRDEPARGLQMKRILKGELTQLFDFLLQNY